MSTEDRSPSQPPDRAHGQSAGGISTSTYGLSSIANSKSEALMLAGWREACLAPACIYFGVMNRSSPGDTNRPPETRPRIACVLNVTAKTPGFGAANCQDEESTRRP